MERGCETGVFFLDWIGGFEWAKGGRRGTDYHDTDWDVTGSLMVSSKEV